MKRIHVLAGLVALLGVMIVGCSHSSNDPVLAEVGSRQIRASDFTQAYLKMKPQDRPDLTQLEAKQALLKDLINKNLMEIAATEVYPDLILQQQWRLRRYRDNQVSALVKKKLVMDQLHITKAMKDSLYANMGRERHLLGIMITDPGVDDFVKVQLDKGVDFQQLAKDYSAKWVGRGMDGDMGWTKAGTLPWPVDRAVWAAPIGTTLGPIKDPMGTYFFKVLDERPAEVASSREEMDGILDQTLRQPLYFSRQKAVQDSLIAAAGPTYPAAGKALLMARYYWEPSPDEMDNPYAKLDARRSTPEFTAKEETTKVVTFQNAPDWTAREFANRLEWYPTGLWPTGVDEQDLMDVFKIMIRDYLYSKAAADLHLTDDPEFKAKMQNRAKEMRVTYFYYNDVINDVNPTQAEIDAYFEAHKDSYKAPPSYKVAMFSSKNEALMKNLAEDWKAGASFTDLRNKYSKSDPALAANGETEWLFEGQDVVRDNTVSTLKEGGVSDPVVRADVSTVYRLVARRPERLMSYGEIKQQVDQDAKTFLGDKKLNEFLDQEKAKVGVKVYTEALEQLAVPADTTGTSMEATGAQTS
jgi:parvulin-like peptidyl-prolyl isomerase